jgi:hypothetical protein
MLATTILTISFTTPTNTRGTRARLLHQSQDGRTLHYRGRDFGLSSWRQAHAEAAAFAAERGLHVLGCLYIPVYGSGDLKGKHSTWTFTLSAEPVAVESVTF